MYEMNDNFIILTTRYWYTAYLKLSAEKWLSGLYKGYSEKKVSSVFKSCHGIDAVTLLRMCGQFVDPLATQQHHL